MASALAPEKSQHRTPESTAASSRVESTDAVVAAVANLVRAAKAVARSRQDRLGATGTPLAVLRALSRTGGDDRPGDLALATGVAPSVVEPRAGPPRGGRARRAPPRRGGCSRLPHHPHRPGQGAARGDPGRLRGPCSEPPSRSWTTTTSTASRPCSTASSRRSSALRSAARRGRALARRRPAARHPLDHPRPPPSHHRRSLMSATTAAGSSRTPAPAAPEPSGEMSAPADPRGHDRPARRPVHRHAQQHHRLDRAADDHRRPARHPAPVHLGDHRGAARHHRQHPDLGQAVRPVQQEAARPALARRLRRSARSPPACRTASASSSRCRVVQGLGMGGLTALTQSIMGAMIAPRAAWSVCRLHGCRHGRRHRERPAARRRHRRQQPRLALDVLRLHPARRSSPCSSSRRRCTSPRRSAPRRSTTSAPS